MILTEKEVLIKKQKYRQIFNNFNCGQQLWVSKTQKLVILSIRPVTTCSIAEFQEMLWYFYSPKYFLKIIDKVLDLSYVLAAWKEKK